MISIPSLRIAAVATLLSAAAFPDANADTFYWGGTSSSGTNPPVGGTATWVTNATPTRWTLQNYAGVGTPGYFAWADGNTAVFGGTDGTVNIGNSYTLVDFNVETSGYIFEFGATRTLTLTNFGGAGLSSSVWRPTTNATRTLVFAVEGDTEFTGLLTDATNGTSLLNFTKQGAGTLTLPNSNSLTGIVTAGAGVLRVGNNNAFGPGTVVISASATLAGANQTLTISNAVSVGGSSGSPSILAGAENISVVGKTAGSAGASRGLQNNISPGKTLTLGDVDISPDTANNRTMFFSGSGETLVSGTIANGNGVTTNSISLAVSGSITLASSNSYTGTTTMAASNTGVVRLGHDNSFGTGVVTFSGGTLQAHGGPRTLANNFTIGGDVTFGGSNAIALNGTTTVNNSRDVTNNVAGGLVFSNVVIGIDGTARTLILHGSNSTTFAGQIANSSAPNVASLDIRSTGLTVLNASNSYSGNTVIRGSVDPTNIPGAVVKIGSAYPFGSPGGSNTVNSGAQLDLNGQSVSGEDLRILGSGFQEAGALVNSASAAASWAGPIALLGATTVATTNGNIAFSGVVSGANSGFSLIKTGSATLTLSGANTYVGNTIVNAGRLDLATNSTLRFVIQANGTNNSVSGAGSAGFNGAFDVDLALAGTNLADSWTLVSVASPTYGTNFIVNGFNTSGGGIWTLETNNVTYEFSQASGVLEVTAVANAYTSWLTNYPSLTGTNAVPSADPDSDGFNNGTEFAFDGNPTMGTPALMTAVKGGTNVLFRYVGRIDSATNYHVLSTANLATGPWVTNTNVTVTNSADQSGILLPAEYVRREFSVPGTNNGFYRIEATVPAP
ncbi:MAG: autotransporter-associated beta strand repeat-containing protein [Chthoniobacterales bacterium]|nr:autotransporter-associated beta strand repeat-containing protein [Chthoniobacterales bacterium]